ncbi:hypothetical protein [Pyramidobacter piscolens]|uniref:hypothetical protein n=1 Tax=Pyramidobacter piscolens TaxID=638849 RepID=UPI00058AE1CE|nr:hypothetical protein [Pyramidobacter piscolens]
MFCSKKGGDLRIGAGFEQRPHGVTFSTSGTRELPARPQLSARDSAVVPSGAAIFGSAPASTSVRTAFSG